MPAGNTYTAIAEQTISSPTASVTFSSIPSTYTDLVLVVYGIPTTNTAGQRIRINGDTGTNYSTTLFNGDVSGARSARQSNNTAFDGMNYQQAVSPNFSSISHFFSYANTNMNKTVITRYGGPTFETTTSANLYRSTSAITSITALLVNGNYASGTIVSLYGIASA